MKFFSLFLFLLIFTISNAQVTRLVLFEEGTNASCAPCATNNPILDAFLLSNSNNVTAIKYHASWPGVDPMYSANPTQNTERIVNYYNMGATGVPYCNCDGIIQDIWPFSTSAFTNAMNTRLAVPTPVGITVVDTRIPGDSIRSIITVNLVSNLPSGNYKLRVMAIEKKIVYTSPPGTNGETVFHQVFRWAYPNTTGVNAPTTTGTYQFIYKYKRLSTWVDTSVYTVAFVQNDNNKEVMNSGIGHYIATGISGNENLIPDKYYLSQNYPNPFNPVTTIKCGIAKTGNATLKVFDVLGNEVAVLLNGNVLAGNYELSFNGSSLASGTYFYKLTAGDFTEIKKMLMIK
jgi:hypothetical protein